MRDVGLKGEGTFTSWCGDVGLVPNKSVVDKTGWDFFVEFPFDKKIPDAPILHHSSVECKVQVKATDKRGRKVPITLSNLRRLATAPLPAFLLIIEYDNTSSPKRAFIVHIDDYWSSKILKKIYEVGQSGSDKSLNKITLTINYDESNQMKELSGDCLRETILSHIKGDIVNYVSNKQKHLASTGYEKGYAQINFDVTGEENLRQLIDASLVPGKKAPVSNFRAIHTRFGIISNTAYISETSGWLEMSPTEPVMKGLLHFKEDRLSIGLSFPVQLYTSPFNNRLPDELKKIRLDGYFFDIKFSPFIGAADYTFTLGQGIRMPVNKFNDAIKLVKLLCSQGNRFFMELECEDQPPLEFKGISKYRNLEILSIAPALECAEEIVRYFGLIEEINISLSEIVKYQKNICQFHEIIGSQPNLFKVEFTVEGILDLAKEVACIFSISVPLGSHLLGILIVLTGQAEEIAGGQYRLATQSTSIEKKISTKMGRAVNRADISEEIDQIAKKYTNYNVVVIDRL